MCPWNSAKIVQLTAGLDFFPRAGEPPDSDSAPAALDSDSDSLRAGQDAARGVVLPGTDAPSLVRLMRMTREEWDRWTRGSAIRRAGYEGFRRNVAVALGNWLASGAEAPEDAVAVLRDALEDESELVREHAAWALRRAGRSGGG